MANPAVLTKALVAASASIIASTSTGSSGVAFPLVSTVVTLDTQRRVQIVCSGNEATNVFTILGTNDGGNPIQEAVSGVSSASTASLNDFYTISSVIPTSSTVSGVLVGTNTSGSTPWKLVNVHIAPVSIQLGGRVSSGSCTWNIEYTYDAPPGVWPNTGNIPWTYPTACSVLLHAALNGVTGTSDGTIAVPVRAWRLTNSSGTGTSLVTGIQAGVAN